MCREDDGALPVDIKFCLQSRKGRKILVISRDTILGLLLFLIPFLIPFLLFLVLYYLFLSHCPPPLISPSLTIYLPNM